MLVKFYGIEPSDKQDKKYKARFVLIDFKNNKIKNYSIYFGDSKYEDYTLHHDEKRKSNYIKRHIKNENWNDPLSAGTLSRYILWNKKTIKDSILDYKKRFGF